MNLHAWLTDPGRRIALHTTLALVWAILTVATTLLALYLGESPFIAWITFMSGYALFVGHWSAREGAAPSAEEESSP